MREDVLEVLEEIGIDKAYKKLLAFTHAYLKTRSWKHGKNVATYGRIADDFVSDVLTKTLEGERNWNKAKCSSLMIFMKNNIESEISNSLQSAENKRAVNIEFQTEEGEHRALSSNELNANRYTEDEDAQISYRDRLEFYRKKIQGKIKDDDDYIEFVFEEIALGHSTPIVLSERLDIPIGKIDYYKIRIKKIIKEANSEYDTE